MHIYVDESGSFAVPRTIKGPSVACVGALVVPEASHVALLAAFRRASRAWPLEKGEVKGKLLNEKQANEALCIVAAHGAVFDCVAIDLGLHTTPEILAHKEAQARAVLKHVTPQHHPNLIREVNQLAANYRSLSVPDYIWVTCMTCAVFAVLANKILYYVQRAPAELGNFFWTFDAKDRGLSRCERLWALTAAPAIQSRSLREPIIHLVEGDYSHHAKFTRVLDQPPEHLAPYVRPREQGERYECSDVKLMLSEHRRFHNSRLTFGLQVADVVTSVARRALVGNIGRAGWRALGGVMVQRAGEKEVIDFVRLTDAADRRWRQDPPYYEVLPFLQETARPLLAGRAA